MQTENMPAEGTSSANQEAKSALRDAPCSRLFEADLAALPKALRHLADEIQAPDHLPAMCLRDAAAMIESLKRQLDAVRGENRHIKEQLATQSNASHSVSVQRLVRRLERRDRKVAGLKRKIRRLEEALSWRTIDLESLSRNIRHEVQEALCNVRMIPVFGGKRDTVIAEVKTSPANDEWWHRRDQAPIQRTTLTPVATHGLFYVISI